MTHAIQISNLSKSFKDNRVLKGVNINVPQNAVYGFLGNNGAGKSTLIRTALGLLKADHGEIKVEGHSINFGDTSFKRNIGSLVDSPCLYLQLTPKEFLSMGQCIRNLPKTSIDHALELVNMSTHKNTSMQQFSLGMKQRIALANALLGSPKLLILDEPTNGLDPVGMQEIRTLLKELPERLNTTIFLSSHLLDEIQKTATHVGVLHQGQIKVESSLKELLSDQPSYLKIKTSDAGALNMAMAHSGLKISRLSEDEIKIKDVTFDLCSDINKLVVESGLPLYESKFYQPTLEHLFFDYVNDKEQLKYEEHNHAN